MRSLASVYLATFLTLSAVSGAGSLAAQTKSANGEPNWTSAESDLEAAAKKAGRSIWGLVPSAPRYKSDVTPELVRGTAVAIDDGTFLTSCAAIDKTSRVGIVRLRKYYLAKVFATDPTGDACLLSSPEAPVNLGLTYRDPSTLKVAEAVIALVTTSASQRVEILGRAADPSLRRDGLALTTVELPANTESAVYIDGRGNLLGIGPSRYHVGSGSAITSLSPLVVPKDQRPASTTD